MGVVVRAGEKFKFIQTLKDEPFLRWIDYWDDYLFDPDVKKHRHRRWEAVGLTVSFQEFQEMENIRPEFKKGGKHAIKPQRRPEDDDYQNEQDLTAASLEAKSFTSDEEWIRMWEIWDREHDEKHLVAENVKHFLEKDSNWPFEFEVGDDPFPCTVLEAKIDPQSSHSISEFQPIEDQIFERSRIRSIQSAIVKKLAPRYLYNSQGATKAQMRKFLSSNVLDGIEVKNPAGIQLAPVPQVPAGFFEFDSVLKDDLKDVSGQSEIDQGELAKTATEANIIEGRSAVRKSARNIDFENFVARSMAKFGWLIQQFQTEEISFRISGDKTPDGQDQFMSVSKQDIQGEFDFEVIPGSMEHRNETIERSADRKVEEPAASEDDSGYEEEQAGFEDDATARSSGDASWPIPAPWSGPGSWSSWGCRWHGRPRPLFR